jgi:NADH:ubiquinone oxidoreductase subunit E
MGNYFVFLFPSLPGNLPGVKQKSLLEESTMSDFNIDSILEGRRSQPHQLIEVLQDVQDAFGYLPQQAMETAARELGVPLIEVYRAAHFYKAFSLKPNGKNVVTVCTGTACHVRGSDLLIDQVQGQLDIKPGETTEDGLFSLERVNCLGCCALGPEVVINGTYYHQMSPGKLRSVIEGTRQAGKEKIAHA